MATLNIKCHETQVDIHVDESDKHSELVRVKFDKYLVPEELRYCDEMYLTPYQLEQIGMFFLRQSELIRTMQRVRKAEKDFLKNNK